MQGGVIVVGFAVCLKIKVIAGFLEVGDTFKLHSTRQYYNNTIISRFFTKLLDTFSTFLHSLLTIHHHHHHHHHVSPAPFSLELTTNDTAGDNHLHLLHLHHQDLRLQVPETQHHSWTSHVALAAPVARQRSPQ